MSSYCWAAALMFGPMLLGCSGKSSDCTVSGTVMFDDQPVPDGDIVFRDAEDKVRPAPARSRTASSPSPSSRARKRSRSSPPA